MGGVSAAVIEGLDLRESPLESLPELLQQAWSEASGAMLTTSRRPSKRWTQSLTFARPLILSSAPLYELILWVDRELDLPVPEHVAHEQQELLAGYHRLFSADGGDVREYAERLRRHITEQESGLYPELGTLAAVERATRELSYEHRGLEKGAQSLAAAVQAHAEGSLSKKDKDRLDLDFFHLLEHHLERERDAVFPAWQFLVGRPAERERVINWRF